MPRRDDLRDAEGRAAKDFAYLYLVLIVLFAGGGFIVKYLTGWEILDFLDLLIFSVVAAYLLKLIWKNRK